MYGSDEGVLSVIACIVVFLFFVGLPPYNTSTVYYEMCGLEGCASENMIRGWYKFRVMAPEQTVVMTTDRGHVARLSNCEVFDRKNWHCGEYSMADGTFPPPSGWSPQEFRSMNKVVWYARMIASLGQ